MTTRKAAEEKIVEGDTGHVQVPADGPLDATSGVGGDGPMPMGMNGRTPEHEDADQKSSHVKPKTVQGVLPDGSPKFMDPSSPQAKKAFAIKKGLGKYRALGNVRYGVTDENGNVSLKDAKQGEEIEISHADAATLPNHLELV